jgi:hypothetical protein
LKKRQKKRSLGSGPHTRKVQCLKDGFQWMNHKTASIPQTRDYLWQRLEVEEASRAPLPTLNIFSHFSRDEIGMLVEELCRTGLHFVAANQDDLKKHEGLREVIFYPRRDDFKALKDELAYPLITRLLTEGAIDDMRSVTGCTASTSP